MSDFQVVNKKKKSRKRRSETVCGTSSAPSGGLPHDHSSASNLNNSRNRRKSSCSMPVSDKSDSSDLDSVHSLPVSAKLSGGNSNSYAERVNLSNNHYQVTSTSSPKEKSSNQNHQKIEATPFLNSVEHFPELCHRVNNSNNANNNNIFNNVINNMDNNNVNSVSVNNVENNRRPVVIIPILNKEPLYEVSELTFGFEVNEQLLALDYNINSVENNNSESEKVTLNHNINNNNVNSVKTCNADSFTARFIAPKIIEFNYNHDKIVSYVGTGKFFFFNLNMYYF